MDLQNEDQTKWWNVKDDCADSTFDFFPYSDNEEFLTIYMVSEKSIPEQLSQMAVKG